MKKFFLILIPILSISILVTYQNENESTQIFLQNTSQESYTEINNEKINIKETNIPDSIETSDLCESYDLDCGKSGPHNYYNSSHSEFLDFTSTLKSYLNVKDSNIVYNSEVRNRIINESSDIEKEEIELFTKILDIADGLTVERIFVSNKNNNITFFIYEEEMSFQTSNGISFKVNGDHFTIGISDQGDIIFENLQIGFWNNNYELLKKISPGNTLTLETDTRVIEDMPIHLLFGFSETEIQRFIDKDTDGNIIEIRMNEFFDFLIQNIVLSLYL